MKLVPVTEFKWPSQDEIGEGHYMTCENHQFLWWSTKHPAYRNIHYLGLADGVELTKENAVFMWEECPCEYKDLRVIVE